MGEKTIHKLQKRGKGIMLKKKRRRINFKVTESAKGNLASTFMEEINHLIVGLFLMASLIAGETKNARSLMVGVRCTKSLFILEGKSCGSSS